MDVTFLCQSQFTQETPKQSKTIQKYQQLAKDAQSNGDPVLAQNYLQHADHFLRRFNELNERELRLLNVLRKILIFSGSKSGVSPSPTLKI